MTTKSPPPITPTTATRQTQPHWLRRIWARRWFRVTTYLGAPVCAYLLVGNLLHHWILPSEPADPATYPRVGDKFGSKAQGMIHRIVGIKDGWAVLETRMEPGAKGPPLHLHKGFSETFLVKEGRLSIDLGTRVISIGPGERYEVRAGTPHRPFNPTDKPVVLADKGPAMPLSFAACLVQLYRFFATNPSGLQVAMQLSVIDPICDTHLVEVPAAVQAVGKVALAPIARLLGYKGYDRSRSLHP